MSQPVIILVGGFLGAGKTSLIIRACQILQRRGMRVAAIMNDQDAGLVDTHLVSASQINSREVAGGCFCCRFSDLLEAVDELTAYKLDIIFAEPVGSCIDLSATIIQPLKAFYSEAYRVAPLTILFDPGLASKVYCGEADDDLTYLFRNQLAEADILCAAKSDLYRTPFSFPIPVDSSLSAKTGDGVEQWLDLVMHSGRIAGSQLLQVDYSRYADAEAALGWLNLHAHVHLKSPASPASLVGPLLDDLEKCISTAGIQIAHLKVFDRAKSGFVKASICANGSLPEAEGDLAADPALAHELAINLRAIGDPEQLAQIVSTSLAAIDGQIDITHQSSFRPAPPKPEHRFAPTIE